MSFSTFHKSESCVGSDDVHSLAVVPPSLRPAVSNCNLGKAWIERAAEQQKIFQECPGELIRERIHACHGNAAVWAREQVWVPKLVQQLCTEELYVQIESDSGSWESGGNDTTSLGLMPAFSQFLEWLRHLWSPVAACFSFTVRGWSFFLFLCDLLAYILEHCIHVENTPVKQWWWTPALVFKSATYDCLLTDGLSDSSYPPIKIAAVQVLHQRKIACKHVLSCGREWMSLHTVSRTNLPISAPISWKCIVVNSSSVIYVMWKTLIELRLNGAFWCPLSYWLPLRISSTRGLFPHILAT